MLLVANATVPCCPSCHAAHRTCLYTAGQRSQLQALLSCSAPSNQSVFLLFLPTLAQALSPITLASTSTLALPSTALPLATPSQPFSTASLSLPPTAQPFTSTALAFTPASQSHPPTQ